MKIKNYEQVREDIRAFLPQYLNDSGISKLSSFHCLSKTHQDSSASSGVLPDGTHFHCLGCGMTGDIFDAVHLKQDRPNAGPGFVTENLLYLAERYGVPVEKTEMTEEEIVELDTFRAYAKASEFFTAKFEQQPETNIAKQEIVKRGWTGLDAKKLGIGYCSGWSQVSTFLESLGFEREFLRSIELLRTDIFNGNNLLFTMKDQYGRAVGFAARDLTWSPDKNTPKYINTSSAVSIFKKGKLFYNLHNAMTAVKVGKPLYLTEGYPNVVAAEVHGMNNTCAIGGTALTEDHVLLLRAMGVSSVILCLDGDQAGQDMVERLLDTKLNGLADIHVKVVIVPNGNDPDEYIKADGVEAFQKLAQWSAFEWRLKRFPSDTSADTMCEIMIPLIVGEPSHITQDTLCEALAKESGKNINTIRSELARLQSARERKIAQERSVVIDQLMKTVRGSPSDAEMYLNNALTQLNELNQKWDQDKLGPEACLKSLDEQRVHEEEKTGEFAGFRLGPDLEPLEEALAGEWKKDVFMCFGGAANSGKTSLLAKVAYEIARQPNDACVIFHTIDDTAAQFLPKLICIAEGSRDLTINEVRNPQHYKNLGMDDVPKRRGAGYQLVREIVKDGRLILKDANDGNSLSYADSLIRYYKQRYPDRNIVYILDNLHKLQDFGASSESERVKFKGISEMIKNMATRHHITILCTVEYTKLPAGTKPTNYNIAETVQLIYDSNFIAHLYNDVHERGEELAGSVGMTHAATVSGKHKVLPVIELFIGKNKITDFKNKIFFEFFPASSDFKAKVTSEMEHLIEENKKNQQAEKSKSGFNKQKLWG
jgi:DNA primase catalytic core